MHLSYYYYNTQLFEKLSLALGGSEKKPFKVIAPNFINPYYVVYVNILAEAALCQEEENPRDSSFLKKLSMGESDISSEYEMKTTTFKILQTQWNEE